MKSLKLIFLFVAMAVTGMSFAQKATAEQARIYNDKIIDEQIKVQDAENVLIDLVTEGDAQKVEKGIKDFLNQVEVSTLTVKLLDKFDGKDDFKKECLSFFKVYKSIGENEYKKVLKIYQGKEYTTVEEAKANKILQEKNAKRKAAFEHFSAFQQKFAAEYGFKIQGE